MQCFDLRNVIFITNKWDTLYSEDYSSDEDEETKTWNTLKFDIKNRWPSVREELIFKMNLKDVSSGKTNTSMTKFEEFKRVLESMVKKAENNRLLQHLRFLQQVLTPLSKGLSARIELKKKTEEECLSLLERHRKKIDELTKECIEARNAFLVKNIKAKEDIAQGCYEYMSTSVGKTKVLNPPNRTPIAYVNRYTVNFEKEIEGRVDLYVEKYLQSDDVLKMYESIQKDINTFCEKVISDLSGMEDDWIKNTSDTWPLSTIKLLLSLVVFTSPVWLTALTVGFGVSAAAAAGLVYILVGTASVLLNKNTDKDLNDEYKKQLRTIRKKICDHLDENCGVVIIKLISKVTEDVLPKKLQTFKTMIQQISESRDEITANQRRLKVNADKIRNMEETVSKLAECLNS
uniref:Uncharacterized protein n=1 Tax=Magallana gigas TaxID=29159 RepID=A0A8W8NTW0_MAGGI